MGAHLFGRSERRQGNFDASGSKTSAAGKGAVGFIFGYVFFSPFFSRKKIPNTWPLYYSFLYTLFPFPTKQDIEGYGLCFIRTARGRFDCNEAILETRALRHAWLVTSSRYVVLFGSICQIPK